jgi:hypothetical protein
VEVSHASVHDATDWRDLKGAELRNKFWTGSFLDFLKNVKIKKSLGHLCNHCGETSHQKGKGQA